MGAEGAPCLTHSPSTQIQVSSPPPTPLETLEMAYDLGKKAGLKYVYLGNIITENKENTYCPKCNNLAIKRLGYQVEILGVNQKGECSKCGRDLNIRI